METYIDLWNEVLAYCKDHTNKTAYDLWLSPIEILNFENGIAHLEFSNQFKKNTVVAQYGDMIREAFEQVCGFPVIVTFLCPEDFMTEKEQNKMDLENFKNDTLTFNNFIVGPSNKFAYAAATAIAADPGGQINSSRTLSNYNPLFIYGNSGLGKTHLLNAISYEIKRNYPDMKITYVRSEDFLNEFIAALGNHTTDEFHTKYRNSDVLLIDDIQFIAGKDQTEEEFFHTFNALVDNGKQVVLTSDRPPKEIQSLTDRLRSRFVSGLLADIQAPEFETRCAIIKRKAELLDFEISDAVVQYIAEKIKSNIRQLEGTTKKLHAICQFSNQVPTISLAQNAIKDILNDIQPIPVTINHIVSEVSRTTGVSVDDIYSTKQTSKISLARKMCFYIIREVTGMSYSNIGKEFDRDHSTVLYNIESVGNKMKKDSVLNSQVNDIINNIKDER